MKLCYFAVFLLIFIVLIPIGYSLDYIEHDVRRCNTSFEQLNTTVKLDIYGIDEFKPYLIAKTQAIYSYEIISTQYKIDSNEIIKAQIEIVCDGVIIPNNNKKDYIFDKMDSEIKNSVKYHLNGTFNVPQNARYCEARGRIYGKNVTEGYSENNHNCYIKGVDLDGNEVERKDVWTREEFFMKKWVEELEMSRNDQREQNEESSKRGMYGILIGAFLTIMGTYFAQKWIYNKRLMKEHNEKIYAPILKSIDFSKEKIINFLPIYKDLISWGSNKEERLNNDYDYWINIRDSPRSVILKAHDEELYNRIYNFFEESTTKYNHILRDITNKSVFILKDEISKIRKKSVIGFLIDADTDMDRTVSSILKKKTPNHEFITIEFNKKKEKHTESIILTREELKRIKPEIEKIKEFKKLKIERKKILKDANEIKKEIEDYLNLRRTLKKDVNKFENWLINGLKYFLSRR